MITLSFSPAISSLNNSVSISTSGQILTQSHAQGGSAEDIQAAVDQVAAEGGGNVYLPQGTFNFVEVNEAWQTVNIPAGVNLIGAPTTRDANGQVTEWKTVLVMPWDVPGSFGASPYWWFRIIGNGDPNKPSRFSDIKLVGYRSINPDSVTVHLGISVENVVDFRIDHCCLENIAGRGVGVYGLNCRGVIDHNQMYNTAGWDNLVSYTEGNIGYAIALSVNIYAPFVSTMDILGKYTSCTVFIEDNYFSKWRHAVAGGHGSHYVFRYNLISEDYGHFSLDNHGLRDTQTGAAGGRACEIYENTIINCDWHDDSPSGGADFMALFQNGGGCGVWFNNYVDTSYIGGGILLYTEDYVASSTWHLKDFYLWSNTGNWVPSFNGIPSGFTADRNVLADWNRTAYDPTNPAYPNVDPTWSIAGYKPYTYPHPLTLIE